MNLDIDYQQFSQILSDAGDILERLYARLPETKVYENPAPPEVRQAFDTHFPSSGMPLSELLDTVEKDVFRHATLNVGPYYYGYITGGGNQAAILGEMIKAALNQNNLKWHSSPVSTELEKLVTGWIAEFIGYPTDSAGVLLDGGSVANFEALAVARKIKAPVNLSEEGLYNAPPMTVYVSKEGHSSFDKAIDMLGLGKKHLRKIPVGDDFRIDLGALDRQIQQDKAEGLNPICGIGIAGTTNTGAIDDLGGVADICQKHDLWFHVDAAYGGPAASLEEFKSTYHGIDRADSLIVNPHKWMYVPFGAACVLVKNPEHMHRTFSLVPDYLKVRGEHGSRTDLMEYNLPLTKDFKALKVWMTMKAYGSDRLKQMIRQDIEHAQYFADLIRKDQELELMAPAPLSIVCFRYHPPGTQPGTLDSLNNRLINCLEADGRVFLTGTEINGKTVLRVCLINHRIQKEHMDRLIRIVKEVGKDLSIT